ncbi:MAG: MASE1 domain-containing protein, partial [Pyrinomonadaceae bacterium]|nr:MASE1 domain-containing protein [Phycisphaerales bacterium]
MRYFIQVFILAAVYAGIAKLSLYFAFVPGAAAPVWPGSGVALAALIIGGYRMWPGIALGAYALAAVTTPGPIGAVGITIGNTLEPVIALYLLRRVAGAQIDLGRVRDVVLLIVLAGVVSTAVSAAAGVGTLYFMDILPAGKFQTTLLVWWIGNLSGCVVVGPFLLAFHQRPVSKPTASTVVECLLLTLALIGVAEVVFGFFGSSGVTAYSLTFLLFPPLVWASLRFGHRGASAASVGVSLLAVIATATDIGPFVGDMSLAVETFATLSAFMTTLAATGLILSAAINERQRAAQARIEAEAKYHLLFEHASDGIFLSDKQGTYLQANRRGLEMLGYTIDE